ncbi:MAG: TMEM175 family protein [Sphingobacteriia bacterium]|jgi:uncharacterized membrane protein
MNSKIDNSHPKQDFQVERIAFLSDAVFAIAITLLIIEFKVPPINEQSTFNSVLQDLFSLRNHFFALLLSFALIATYWIQHHFLFKHLHNYNNKLIIVNFLVLLPIIFFPFTTAFVAESSENGNVIMLSFRLFLLNNIIAGGILYYFYWLMTSKHSHFLYKITKEERFNFNMETIFKTGMFLAMFLFTFFTNDLTMIFWGIFILLITRKLIVNLSGRINL